MRRGGSRRRARSARVTAIVVAADVGGPDWYHAGDEAMLAANLEMMRRLRPDAVFTVMSRDPEWTARHYRVQAIPVLGFGPSLEQRLQLEREALEGAGRFRKTGSLDRSHAGADVIGALAKSHALVLSGGGNLCSKWPEHIHDRATLIEIASTLDKPVVILGQTIGPHLDEEDRKRLARTLPLASVIGLRGRHSAKLVRSLGVDPSKILEQLDDAWFLNPTPSAAVVQEAARHGRPWIAVTLAPLVGDPGACLPVLRSLGRQFSELARTIDADLVFLPHWNALPGCESEALFARRLFGFLEEPQRATLLPVYSGEDVCWLTRQAGLVVSMRYHPIVFGLSGGVPCVAIYPDEHTRVRHAECLQHAGLERLAISVQAAVKGQLPSAALLAWKQRDAIRHQLDSHAAAWRVDEARKWSLVAKALAWPATPLAASSPAAAPMSPEESEAPVPRPRVRRRASSALDISAVVLTRNGAGRLERCLQSIADAKIARELVVFVDQTSTDDSESIARGFTSKVLPMETQGYIESCLPRMAAGCSGEFVLRLDDDESLGGDWDAPAFGAQDEAGFTHFLVPRRWLVPGQDCFISAGAWFPDLQLRLFRNDPALIRWPSDLHEHLAVDGAGAVLWDRWIDHHVLWQQTRAERARKCEAYRNRRPDRHLSHFYLWEEQAVRLSPNRPIEAAAAEPLESGAEVLFGSEGTAAPYKRDGWSHAEPWGTWTDGHHAVLRIPLRRPPTGAVEVILEANAFVRAGHPILRVSAFCAETLVAEWHIDTPDVACYSAIIPAWLAARQGELTLSLHIENPKSPRELAESPDGRRLGLGVRRLRLHGR